VKRFIGASLGVVTCTIASASLIPLFRTSSFRTFLPLVFLGIILLVAVRFGNIAGILGTVVAALIFAGFLFEPRLSLAVRDSAAKSNLIWMLIGGICMSELVGYHSPSGTNGGRV